MARPLRIQFEGAWYHIMNRGINRKNIFYIDHQKHYFLTLLAKTIKIYGIEIHAYCLMDNHYHLIVHTPRGNISHAMKYLNSSYAQFVNTSMKRDGPLFRGRFMSVVISADDYLLSLSRYIHLNPIKAQMVTELKAYQWSSYIAYIDKRLKPEWLSTNEIIKRFGVKNFRDNYMQFVSSQTNKSVDEDFNISSNQPVLGNDDFRQMIDDYVKSHSPSAEIVGKDHILVSPSMESIINDVAAHFNTEPEYIYRPSQTVLNTPRRIAIYLCRALGGFHLHEIGKAMGGISYKTISNTINRVKGNKNQLMIANLLIEEIRNNSRSIYDEQ